MKVSANGLEFEVVIDEPTKQVTVPDVEQDTPTVLLIMGLGMQLIAWPDTFVRTLNDAGYRVIRFDNRDIGLSDKTHTKPPNLAIMTIRYRLGMQVRAPYSLREMVADTAGILDALGVARCHVIGVSMGGMIAQGLASRHPERVQTLTSIMSTTGARNLPKATPRASMAFIARPRSQQREDVIDHFAKVFAVIGSPKYPTPAAELRARVGAAYERSYFPLGTLRQLAAIIASGDRSNEVRAIKAPTLVIHGKHDPLVPPKNGEDTAQKIPGSQYIEIDGMGHDLGVLPKLVERILPFLRKHTLA